MTAQDRNIFFALVRAAIWTGDDGQPTVEHLEEAAALIPANYDWKPMFMMCRDHAILGVVAHAIMRLPDDIRPQMKDQKLAMSFLANTIRRGHVMRGMIASLFATLEFEGCHPVLMKGESLSVLYPRTCRRAIGDVDICVREDEYPRAKRLLADFCGMGENEGVEDDVHVQMRKGKMEFELHRKPFDPTFKDRGEAFLNWTREQLSSKAKSLELAATGRTVAVPGDYCNLLMVYDHMLKHILYETPSLRQFVDLALVLRQAERAGVLDHARFLEDMQRFSSLKLWQTVSGVLHYQLGMSTAEIPGWDERLARGSQGRFLDYMVSSGNFGRNHAKHGFSRLAVVRKLQHTLFILRFPSVIRREMLKRKVSIYL